MVYAALHRGINVGGNNQIEMKRLKDTFLRAGMENVTTYINSGNIIFIDRSHWQTEIAGLLEKAILEDFGLSIRVLIRSLAEFDEMMKVLPKDWTNDDQMKSDVLFLWVEVDPETAADQLNPRAVDRILNAPGAILWSVDRGDVTKTGLVKIIGTPLYRQITVRNVNSARKIHEIMGEKAQGKGSKQQ